MKYLLLACLNLEECVAYIPLLIECILAEENDLQISRSSLDNLRAIAIVFTSATIGLGKLALGGLE